MRLSGEIGKRSMQNIPTIMLPWKSLLVESIVGLIPFSDSMKTAKLLSRDLMHVKSLLTGVFQLDQLKSSGGAYVLLARDLFDLTSTVLLFGSMTTLGDGVLPLFLMNW